MKNYQEILDDKTLRKISALAFSGYLTRGRGCVDISHPDDCGIITSDFLNYLTPNDKAFPENAKEMMEYDTEKELVLSIKDKSGKQSLFLLTYSQLKTTPIDSYREWSRQNGQGRWIPGEVLMLKEDVCDLKAQNYIYLMRLKNRMELCVAGKDMYGDICRTDQIFRLHIDFEDKFESLNGIRITLNAT